MPIISNFKPAHTVDLRSATLDLNEPGLRILDAEQRHVASVLPDDMGFYDLHAARTLYALASQSV